MFTDKVKLQKKPSNELKSGNYMQISGFCI